LQKDEEDSIQKRKNGMGSAIHSEKLVSLKAFLSYIFSHARVSRKRNLGSKEEKGGCDIATEKLC